MRACVPISVCRSLRRCCIAACKAAFSPANASASASSNQARRTAIISLATRCATRLDGCAPIDI
eukprot:4506929-Prymnesium_polylepis.1